MSQEPPITREQLVQELAAVSHATYLRHLKEANRPFPAGVNEHDPTQHDVARAEDMVSRLEQDPPLYKSTLEWFESQADVSGTRASYRKLYDASRINYPPPQGLEPADDMFQSIRQAGIPEAYVAIVPNGYVCGNGYLSPTAVLAPDGKLIWDVSKATRVKDHWIFGETDLPEPTLVSDTTGVLAIKPQWSGSYFHWMFDVLPRIHLLRGSPLQIQKYLVNTLACSFQHQTLADLGVPGESIIEVDSPFCIRAQDLALTSHIRLVAPAWVCAFLRNEFLKDPAWGGKKRLYVSRRTARHRHVANEDEVNEVLASFKFEEILADGLSVQEQAEAFASASVVVGPHGGGLTNIVFCKPQTKVVEFFAPRYCHSAYWMLANQCNLDYYYLVGEGERPEWSWPAEEAARDPIEVDPDGLVALLKMAGL